MVMKCVPQIQGKAYDYLIYFTFLPRTLIGVGSYSFSEVQLEYSTTTANKFWDQVYEL